MEMLFKSGKQGVLKPVFTITLKKSRNVLIHANEKARLAVNFDPI